MSPVPPSRWRSLRRWLLRLCASLVVAMVAVAGWDAATYDARAWLADYARIKHGMAQGYANLDWVARQRGVDLAALDRRTTLALETAHSRVRAFFVLRDFLRTFDDPHLRLQPRPSEPAAHTPVAGDIAAASANAHLAVAASCEAAGYEEGPHDFRFGFERLPGWRALAAGAFPTGIAGDVGVLRIAQFGEKRYLAACQQVFAGTMDARALQLATRAQLQAQLRQRIAQLRAAGARRLLVDVSGNGGGSEWVSEVIGLMTARSLTRAAPRIVAPACDRSAVWRGQVACDVFGPAQDSETLAGTGAWQGPLLILSDGGTASAAEDFVAWLQQNRVATVIGERSLGAGCGYIDRGAPVALRELPLQVAMPNCSRFLADGRNEMEGLEPDVALDLAADDAPRRLAAILARR